MTLVASTGPGSAELLVFLGVDMFVAEGGGKECASCEGICFLINIPAPV